MALVQAVTKEEARSELLKDYQKDKEKRDRDACKAEQKKRQGAFRKLLEASPFIKVWTALHNIVKQHMHRALFSNCVMRS